MRTDELAVAFASKPETVRVVLTLLFVGALVLAADPAVADVGCKVDTPYCLETPCQYNFDLNCLKD